MRRRGNNEGSIRKRSDGRWEARLRVAGPQRSIYGTTRDEVVRKLRAAQVQVDRGVPMPNERQTVAQYLERWLRDSVQLRVAPRTYTSYAMHVRLHIVPAIGTIPLAKLQPGHVQKLLNDKLKGGLSPATVNRIRSTLRAALNQACKWGEVSRNVATLVDLPKEERPEIEPLTPQEARAFLVHVHDHRWEALFVVALATGLRQGELLGLVWTDIDLDVGKLTVRASLQRINGALQRVSPKTAQSRRTIVLAETAIAALRTQRAQQKRARLKAGEQWQENSYVFTTRIGTPLDAAEVTRGFQEILAEAGLPRKRFHDLRHSCATFLLAQGVSHRDIMAILGHSGITVTMNTYAHVLPETQRDAARRMDAVLRGDELG